MKHAEAIDRAKSLVCSCVVRARSWSASAVAIRRQILEELRLAPARRDQIRLADLRAQWRNLRGRRKEAMQAAALAKETFDLPAWTCKRVLTRLEILAARRAAQPQML